MPTVNFFYHDTNHSDQLSQLINVIKEYLANELSCGEIKLKPSEISIRLIKTSEQGMIANLEAEVTAHAFEERILKQDVFCLNFRSFLMNNINAKDIRVWLLLPQLGHSWE